jgi:transcriptional regulator with XRE-family HTH domain
MTLSKHIGPVLRGYRHCQGKSLADLALASDVAKGNISKIENGGGNVRLDTLCRLATALGFTASDLLREVEASVKPKRRRK